MALQEVTDNILACKVLKSQGSESTGGIAKYFTLGSTEIFLVINAVSLAGGRPFLGNLSMPATIEIVVSIGRTFEEGGDVKDSAFACVECLLNLKR